MAFADVAGHGPLQELLSRALAAGRLPPSLLFSGPEGVGKKTLAVALGRALLCERPETPGCGECRHCVRIDRSLAALAGWREAAIAGGKDDTLLNHRLHPDLMLVEAWKTTKKGEQKARGEIKIEQVRELVAESATGPFESRARLFVVDDAHSMNEAAANSLLKSLEEPPLTSHFVLVTPAPQALLPTIRSRCQQLRFGPLPSTLLEAWLVEHAGLEAQEARLRAALAGGSLALALAFESESFRAQRDEAMQILESAGSGSLPLDAADRLAAQEDLPLWITGLRSLLRDVAALSVGAPRESALNRDLAPRLASLARGPLGSRAGELFERAGEIQQALRGNASRPLATDLLLDALASSGGRR